ncbi:PilZ domain-containing protein [Sphingomonas sp. RS2018]
MDHRPTGQDNSDEAPEGATRTARDSLLLAATLTVTGQTGPVQVRVRNLSEGGLMAEFVGPGGTGDMVVIELRGVGQVRGTIAWVAEGRIGVAFDSPIDPMLARKPVTATSRRFTPVLKPL